MAMSRCVPAASRFEMWHSPRVSLSMLKSIGVVTSTRRFLKSASTFLARNGSCILGTSESRSFSPQSPSLLPRPRPPPEGSKSRQIAFRDPETHASRFVRRFLLRFAIPLEGGGETQFPRRPRADCGSPSQRRRSRGFFSSSRESSVRGGYRPFGSFIRDKEGRRWSPRESI